MSEYKLKHWGTRVEHSSECWRLKRGYACIQKGWMAIPIYTQFNDFLTVVLILQTLVPLSFCVLYFYYLRIKKNINNYMGCLVLHNLTYTQWEQEWQCFRHHHSLFITPPTPNPLPACSLHCTKTKSHVRQPAKSTRSIHSKGGEDGGEGE